MSSMSFLHTQPAVTMRTASHYLGLGRTMAGPETCACLRMRMSMSMRISQQLPKLRPRAASSLVAGNNHRPVVSHILSHHRISRPQPSRHAFFLSLRSPRRPRIRATRLAAVTTAGVLALTLLTWSLYPADQVQRRSDHTDDAAAAAAAAADAELHLKSSPKAPPAAGEDITGSNDTQGASGNEGHGSDSKGRGSDSSNDGAWYDFTKAFERLSLVTDVEWSKLSDRLVDMILPEWSRLVPGQVRKLQRELSLAPGSLADEIWQEAQNANVNPEIMWSARVRVSNDLCDDERTFLSRRKIMVAVALARYLGLKEEDVHPDDVPVIAMCGSGGGLRALVAGTGSLLATAEDGLFDCVTYTSGVSGSCWLQVLYNSSIAQADFGRAIDHLKARIGTHIAYPPVAFSSLLSAPTNKCLLRGVVEKLKGDPDADFGLVDVYGVLLAARLLVPKGELGVDERDFKLSNQREYLRYGQNPLPIYSAVRHEIPVLDEKVEGLTAAEKEDAKTQAKEEAWFQWFEMTPYEVFCEEFMAGIPTWALGRRFDAGVDVPVTPDGLHLPEVRMPLLLGIFGSAFCATLSHYYREVRPLVQAISPLSAVDELISGRDSDLSKVHPIDPASIPNFARGLSEAQRPAAAAPPLPRAVREADTLQLMDAGMSNNLPIYPLLRPGRDVDIIVAFDASADVRTDNWLSVADGYVRQRGVKGWPVGIGWPKPTDAPAKTARELEHAQAGTAAEAEEKLTEAKIDQAARRIEARTTTTSTTSTASPKTERGHDKGSGNVGRKGKGTRTETATAAAAAAGGEGGGKGGASQQPDGDGSSGGKKPTFRPGSETAGELGYCTVWVGTTQERTRSGDPDPDQQQEHEHQHQPAHAPLPASPVEGEWHQARTPDAGIAVVYLPFLANEAAAPGVDPASSDFMSTWNFAYTPAQVEAVVALARANYGEGRAQVRATVRAVYERKRARRLERQRRVLARMARLGDHDGGDDNDKGGEHYSDHFC